MATEDVQRAEKVSLKRKLTGPPRLLGKTRTRSEGEAEIDEVDELSLKCPPAVTQPDVDQEVLSAVKAESCRGGRNDIRNRKTNRGRWWRRFSSVLVCTRRQKKNVEKQTEGNSEGAFRRFRASSDDDKPLLTFQKKLRGFFTTPGRSRSSAVPVETPGSDVDEETQPQSEEALCPPHHQVREPIRLLISESVTDPEQPRAVMDTAGGSETNQTDCDSSSSGQIVEVASSDKDELSSEVRDEQTPQLRQSSANGPSILIQLVPPDEEDEEEHEHFWKGRPSENQNHLLQLFGFEHREQQLLQAARSLVRTAVNAAVVQLSREQQAGSDCGYGESPGCWNHTSPSGPE